SASIIATDKTGTLTQNKMKVVDYFIPGEDGHSLDANPEEWSLSRQMLMNIAVLCNDSYINNERQEIGDPTEIALIQFSNKYYKDYQELRETYERETELPFSSDRKLMSTVNRINGQKMMLAKGGPDVMFDRAEYVLIDGKIEDLTDER